MIELEKHFVYRRTKLVVLYLILLVPNCIPDSFSTPFIFLLGLMGLFIAGFKFKVSYLKVTSPLLIIVSLGLIGVYGHLPLHIFRDIVYSLFPVSLIFLGYWMGAEKRFWPEILRVIVFFALIFSLIHIFQFILNPSLLKENINTIRQSVSNPGTNLIILSIVLGIFQNRLKLGNLFPKFFPRSISLIVLVLSFILTSSRTGLITLIILSFCLLGFISKLNWKSALGFLILIISFVVMLITTPADESETFRSKMLRSVQELSVSDYEDRSDINSHWRGFETFLAIRSFLNAPVQQKIVGQGFGALVDLGFTMTLVEIEFDEIPILHNGYAYILVKTGLFGLICYLLFYFRLIRRALYFKESTNYEQVLFSRILLGLTISLMSSMFVVGGMAEIHDSELLLLLGFSLNRLGSIS